MASGIKEVGGAKYREKLERFLLVRTKTAMRMFRVAGENIMANAKEDTPVDTGALRASGFVSSEARGKDYIVTLGFGGPSASYAIYVHENLMARHRTGRAKFLEINYRIGVRRLKQELARL